MTVYCFSDYSPTITIETSKAANPSFTITSSISPTVPPVNTEKNPIGEKEHLPSLHSPLTNTSETQASKANNDESSSNLISNSLSKKKTLTYDASQLKKVRPLNKSRNKHTGAKFLAGQYSKAKRIQEIITIIVFIPLFIFDLVNFIIYFDLNKWYVILGAAVIGILTADFLSGLVHWVADSYGTVDQFLIGQAFLRNFRVHHIDPTAITRHDFIETNGDNFALCIPILSYLTYNFYSQTESAVKDSYNLHLYLFLLAVFTSMTNQFHKWSHTYFGLPRYITILQDLHLILPRIHHRVHHIAPHDTYFCITVGWLNYPLELINFWENLENIIFKLTGVKPRTDDLEWASKVKKTSYR